LHDKDMNYFRTLLGWTRRRERGALSNSTTQKMKEKKKQKVRLA